MKIVKILFAVLSAIYFFCAPIKVEISYARGECVPLLESGDCVGFFVPSKGSFQYYLLWGSYTRSVGNQVGISVSDENNLIDSIAIAEITIKSQATEHQVDLTNAVELTLDRSKLNGYAGRIGVARHLFAIPETPQEEIEVMLDGSINLIDGTEINVTKSISGQIKTKNFYIPLFKHIYYRLTIT